MYRCYACDTPAQMKCGCPLNLEKEPIPLPEPQKINIASGEDAMADDHQFVTEYA